MRVIWQPQKFLLDLYLPLLFEQWRYHLWLCLGAPEPFGHFIYTQQVSPFSVWPLPYTAHSWNNMLILLLCEKFLYSFLFQSPTWILRIEKVKLLICINEFILSFLSFCLLLIYQRFTYANIGPWRLDSISSPIIKLSINYISNFFLGLYSSLKIAILICLFFILVSYG